MYNHLKDLVLGAAPRRALLDSLLPTVTVALSPISAIDRALSALYDLLGTRETQAQQPIAVALAPMSSKSMRVGREEWEAADEMMAALRATMQAKRAGSSQEVGQARGRGEVASRALRD